MPTACACGRRTPGWSPGWSSGRIPGWSLASSRCSVPASQRASAALPSWCVVPASRRSSSLPGLSCPSDDQSLDQLVLPVDRLLLAEVTGIAPAVDLLELGLDRGGVVEVVLGLLEDLLGGGQRAPQ